MTTADILRAVRDLITPEGAWTRLAGARTSDGRSTCETNPAAVSWCATGALFAVAERAESVRKLAQVLQKQLSPGEGPVWLWNDRKGRTQAEVLALFDRAIAAEEGRG